MELTFKSAGVSARTIDQTGPTNIEPQGVPAGVIGTSVKGPAFVPTTVATGQDFTVQFGAPNNDHFNAPLAVNEWLANQQSATFTRVLGIGTGLRRDQADNTVVGAGFVVGDELPQDSLGGALGPNPYANFGGPLGQTFFLAAFMSESFVTVNAGTSSVGSNYISKSFVSSSGVTFGEGIMYLRGIIMAPSGVFPALSSSFAPSSAPAASLVADGNTPYAGTNRGSLTGSVYLSNGRQEFVMLLNGHKGTDTRYPNVITASFDVTAPNYFVNVMNTDPLKIEEAGHYVYAEYPIHSSQAVVTGSGIVLPESGSSYLGGFEQIAVLTKGANGRNAGSSGQNFENFEDRFRHAYSPWIISQGYTPVSGTVLPAQGFVNLFRLHAKDAGQYPNNRIKFSIENITPGTDARPYGTFDLLVRDITDTDKTRNVLESFRGLSLDPSSDRYIAKAVGDTNTFYNFDAAETSQGIVTDGTYPSRSNFIRVEMSSQVESGQVSEDVLPFGFRGMDYVWPGNKNSIFVSDMYVSQSVIGSTTYQPPIPMRDNIIIGAFPNQTVDRGLYWGVQFTRKTNTAEPNSSTIQESSIASFAKYFPNFDRAVTAEGDVAFSSNYRADYQSSNLFSLSKIKVARNQTTDLVDTNQFVSWSYVRNGDITTSGAVRALVPSDLTDASVRQAAKFSFFMQGGFDGTNPFNYNESVMNNFAIQEEMTNANRGITNGPTVKAYSKALDLIADTTEVDIQLLAVPGIRHSVITDKALLVTEARFDALYLMDIDQYDSTNLVVSGTNAGQITSVNFTANAFRSRGINSSFGAAYFPDVNIRDNIAGAVRTVAPSVAVLGAFGLNDTIGHPWFAPAGFTRGALKNVTESAVNLNRNNLDALQTVNINPLASFANSQGVSVWGQKTLLATESALERVNVRRLLIDIRRKVKRVSDRIVFEQNRAETLARFEQLVKPILKNIQDQAGVERFLVKIDTETTTQADIQNRTIRGKIYVQPTKTLEFLDVAFVLTNNG